MTHVAVIGAGITGVTTAWALRQRGFDVSLFDRNRYAGMETSFANGGQLSASNAEVWNHLGTIIKGMRWMLSPDAPLLINPKPSWHKYSWLAEFLAHIPNYRKNTVATARMAIAAREHLLNFARQAGVNFDLEKRGILHIYRNKVGFEHARKVTALLAGAGLTRREMTPMEMRRIEPTLTGPMVAGYYTETDMTGDIHKFCVGLASACRRSGVALWMGSDVRRVSTTDGKATIEVSNEDGVRTETFDGVVVCAGVASRALASQLGDRVNIYPVKGYSITVELADAKSRRAAPWVSLLDDDAKLVSSRLGEGRFRVAGTAEFNGFSRDIRADRIAPLTQWVRELFPDVSTEHVVPWAGLRPMMPNMMPRVGAGRRAGVYYNTGHGHLGWTLSGVTADMIAERMAQDLLDGRRTSALPLAA